MLEIIKAHPIATGVFVLMVILYSWVAYQVKESVKSQEKDQEMDTTNIDDFAN